MDAAGFYFAAGILKMASSIAAFASAFSRVIVITEFPSDLLSMMYGIRTPPTGLKSETYVSSYMSLPISLRMATLLISRKLVASM